MLFTHNCKKFLAMVNGSSKKKCQQNCSSVFCLTLLLFYSDMVHKQWLKVWFLTSQMPVLSGSINFVPFSTTSKKIFPKIPMKYSKNGQKFAMSENTSNVLFGTCWTPCKKPHISTWSRSRYTFFWMTRYIWYFFKIHFLIGFSLNSISIRINIGLDDERFQSKFIV